MMYVGPDPRALFTARDFSSSSCSFSVISSPIIPIVLINSLLSHLHPLFTEYLQRIHQGRAICRGFSVGFSADLRFSTYLAQYSSYP